MAGGNPTGHVLFSCSSASLGGSRIACAQSEATRFERRDSLREAVFL